MTGIVSLNVISLLINGAVEQNPPPVDTTTQHQLTANGFERVCCRDQYIER